MTKQLLIAFFTFSMLVSFSASADDVTVSYKCFGRGYAEGTFDLRPFPNQPPGLRSYWAGGDGQESTAPGEFISVGLTAAQRAPWPQDHGRVRVCSAVANIYQGSFEGAPVMQFSQSGEGPCNVPLLERGMRLTVGGAQRDAEGQPVFYSCSFWYQVLVSPRRK